MNRLYILDEFKNPIATDDVKEWAAWFSHPDTDKQRQVRWDLIGGLYIVSTVFTGINYNVIPGGDPLIYETLVLGSTQKVTRSERYATRAEAVIRHAIICADISDAMMELKRREMTQKAPVSRPATAESITESGE